MLYCNCIRAALVSIFPRKINADFYDRNTWAKHHWYTSKDRNHVSSCLVVEIRVDYGNVSPKCGPYWQKNEDLSSANLPSALSRTSCWISQKQTDVGEKFGGFCLSFLVCFYNTLAERSHVIPWSCGKKASGLLQLIFLMEVEAFYRITAQSLTLNAETLEEQRPSKL